MQCLNAADQQLINSVEKLSLENPELCFTDEVPKSATIIVNEISSAIWIQYNHRVQKMKKMKCTCGAHSHQIKK